MLRRKLILQDVVCQKEFNEMKNDKHCELSGEVFESEGVEQSWGNDCIKYLQFYNKKGDETFLYFQKRISEVTGKIEFDVYDYEEV